MTKTEARDAGTERGIGFAETFTQDQLMGDLDAQRENIRAAAGSAAVGVAGFRSVDSLMAVEYIGAFTKAANMRFLGRRNALPEVQAQNRRQGLVWALESALTSSRDALAKFEKNLAENPCYAFEWADGAMEAAAKADVATRLKDILEHPEGGVDKMTAFAREQALRGARYPSHSTSQPSNLMASYKTAAYAEFAGRE